MKSAVIRVFATGLLLSAAALTHAQTTEPSRLMRIVREDIKSGKSAAHERVEAAYARAFSKGGYPSYIGMDAMTGATQAWFIEPYASYESMEKAIQASQTEPLKSWLAPLDIQEGEVHTGERTMIATYQPDLSYLPVPANLAKARFINIGMLRVRPGHVPEVTEMRKLLNAAYEKGGQKQRRVVYSVNSGAPAGTYLIFSAMDSLRALDPSPGATSMPDAFGPANLARYNKLVGDIVISNENTLFAINPRMSNPPKEYIEADRDFWAPRHAAVKPATGQ